MNHPTEMAFLGAAKQLVAALQQETDLARTGALSSLASASEVKREAFQSFKEACASGKVNQAGAADGAALRAILQAAEENALVLEAVGATLGQFLNGLRNLVMSMADSGTYDPVRPVKRHVGALHLNAEI